MIIITNEMLDKAFGELRVHGTELYSWSVEELSKRDAYGKDIRYLSTYDKCSDPQKYVDNWMNSTIAKTEVAEYYKNLSFKGEDDMNKYETLLKKYQALYKDFEAYKEVTEGLATNGYYIKNEALEELLECKKRYEDLKEDNDKLRNMMDSMYEEKKKLKEERDDLVKEVYYLHEVINEKNNKCKEKMEKIKQRDKQITELIKRRDIKDKQMTDLIKERDNLAKRLEHINAMSNLEWEFEVVEETETTRTPYDELIDDCVNRRGDCHGCPKAKYCEMFFNTPFKWTQEQIKEYNKTNAETQSTTPYDELLSFCETRHDSCVGCPYSIACDGINHGIRPNRWTKNEIAEYNELKNMDIAEYCNNAINNKENK